MFCKYCGEQLPDDANFCMKCGKSIKPVNNENSVTSQDTSEFFDVVLVSLNGGTGKKLVLSEVLQTNKLKGVWDKEFEAITGINMNGLKLPSVLRSGVTKFEALSFQKMIFNFNESIKLEIKPSLNRGSSEKNLHGEQFRFSSKVEFENLGEESREWVHALLILSNKNLKLMGDNFFVEVPLKNLFSITCEKKQAFWGDDYYDVNIGNVGHFKFRSQFDEFEKSLKNLIRTTFHYK